MDKAAESIAVAKEMERLFRLPLSRHKVAIKKHQIRVAPEFAYRLNQDAIRLLNLNVKCRFLDWVVLAVVM